MKAKDDTYIKELPEKKRGRPLLLGDKLDKQVKSYVYQIFAREGSSCEHCNSFRSCSGYSEKS